MSTGDGFGREQAQAAWLRGVGYARQGQWQQAVRALRSAIEGEPGHVAAHVELARCLAQMGSANEAMRWLDAALDLARRDDAMRVRILRLRGRVALQCADYGSAAQSFEGALDITGEAGAPILNQLAEVMLKSGDYQRGFELFVRAATGGQK